MGNDQKPPTSGHPTPYTPLFPILPSLPPSLPASLLPCLLPWLFISPFLEPIDILLPIGCFRFLIHFQWAILHLPLPEVAFPDAPASTSGIFPSSFRKITSGPKAIPEVMSSTLASHVRKICPPTLPVPSARPFPVSMALISGSSGSGLIQSQKSKSR